MLPIFKNSLCDVISQRMSWDTLEDFRLINEIRQFIKWIAFNFGRASSFINGE